MKLFHHDHNENEPCPHMEGLLQEAAAGRSRGFAKWYALAHAARCHRCGRFLMRMEEVVGRLRVAKKQEPEAEVLDRLAQAPWRNSLKK